MLQLESKSHDLGGGMIVRRILPQIKKRMIGPICFLDHMGPVNVEPNQNIDVRPHPHIGLSTLTYLFEGQQVHRDSLGNVVTILPGEVNWMKAGAGIVHSERSVESDRSISRRVHGLQFWIALPDDQENDAPAFWHYDRDVIPTLENKNYKMTVVAGTLFGTSSPVQTTSSMLFAEFEAKENFDLNFKIANFELAIYVIEGSVFSQTQQMSATQMITFEPDEALNVQVQKQTKFIVIGGEPLSTPRHMWWNFVATSKEKIEIAKEQWRADLFPKVPNENEMIPLPE